MAKSYKQKILKYLNDLQERDVIVVDEERDGYTIFNIRDGYRMTYYPTNIDSPHAVEVFFIVVDYDDYQVQFHCDDHIDVVLIDNSDLCLLSNIHITVDLSLEEDEPEDDRLTVVEKRLDELAALISKLDSQQANDSKTLNEIKETIKLLKSETKESLSVVGYKWEEGDKGTTHAVPTRVIVPVDTRHAFSVDGIEQI